MRPSQNALFDEAKALAQLKGASIPVANKCSQTFTTCNFERVFKQLTQNAREAPSWVFCDYYNTKVVSVLHFPKPVVYDNCHRFDKPVSMLPGNSERPEGAQISYCLNVLLVQALNGPFCKDMTVHHGIGDNLDFTVRRRVRERLVGMIASFFY